MKIKVGTDIININRLKRSIDKHGDKFLDKFLDKSEIDIAKKVETIAGYWAVKEAVSKALGCGIGKELRFKDIIITKDKKGAPSVTINNSNFNILDSSVSISHEKEFAIAGVINIF